MLRTIDCALRARRRLIVSSLAGRGRSARTRDIVELLLVAGFYRTVAYLTRALRLPLEPFAARFTAADATR